MLRYKLFRLQKVSLASAPCPGCGAASREQVVLDLVAGTPVNQSTSSTHVAADTICADIKSLARVFHPVVALIKHEREHEARKDLRSDEDDRSLNRQQPKCERAHCQP
jgi:hypothetical protein